MYLTVAIAHLNGHGFPRVDHGRLVNAHNNDILFPAAMIMWDIRTIAQCCLIMVRFRRGDYRLLSNIQICVCTNIYAIVATTMVNVWSMYGQCMVNVWSIYGILWSMYGCLYMVEYSSVYGG